MSEPAEKKAPSDVCPRCRGVKDPDERLCESCRKKEEAWIAERTQSSNPGEYNTALSKREVVTIVTLVIAIMIGGAVAIAVTTWPSFLDLFGQETLPPIGDLLTKGQFMIYGLIGEATLFVIVRGVLKSYKKSVAEAAEAAKKQKATAS